MTLIFWIGISGVILALLLTLIAGIDVRSDIMRPIGIILISGILSILPKFFFQGILMDIVSLIIYLMAVYYLLGFFYTLDRDHKRKVMITFSILNILWIAFIYSLALFVE
ncbi:hypothetical protein F7C95_05785 [Opitutia bacterium ISCC 51]|nr:hypothetical protein F7C95_05785 [Opitutae bacterium ISCC 51]QXD29475.1 hypothetical protein GA003_05755 [Opitutae bacterium ISCC 52]